MTNKHTFAAGIGVLTISMMLTSSQAINGVIPQMRAALHITQAQSELLSTAPSITVILFILLSSYLAKQIGMKKTILAGMLLAGIGGILPIFSAQFITVLASRMILGAGLGLYNALAVSYISALFTGNTRATLLGVRNSMELIGQTVLIFAAGLLLNISWTFSFAVYALAFPIALLFYAKVPEAQNTPKTAPKVKAKLQPAVYALVLFAIIMVMISNAISVRFASIAAQIGGNQLNPSNYLALMPVLGIIAGLTFGGVYKHLKQTTMHIAMTCFIIANVLIAISGHSLPVLLAGLFLSSIPCAWCFPVIFNQLDRLTTKNTVNLATGLIFVGCNIGNFLAPIAMQVTQTLMGSTSLTGPFYVFAGILAILLLLSIAVSRGKLPLLKAA
ncbi:MAG: MFS transporter [Lactobacillus sp.]|jgi:MFS family permease|nr:MFS transporter [Lactobacillus sp.]